MNYTETQMDHLFIIINTRTAYYKALEELKEKGIKDDNIIVKIIDDYIIGSQKFMEIKNKDVVLFRARRLDEGDFNNHSKGLEADYNLNCEKTRIDFSSTGYDYDNSRECPLGKSVGGRGNIKGMSFLYLAEDEATACSEIDATMQDVISLATFKIKQDVRIIDLNSDCVEFKASEDEKYGVHLKTFINEIIYTFCKPIRNEEDYYTTQLISDHIRKAGFDGIRYRSMYTGKSNYVLFNSHKSKVGFVDSRLVLFEGVEKHFFDCNNNKRIIASQPKVKNEYAKRLILMGRIIYEK